jgi:hypothetical protein
MKQDGAVKKEAVKAALPPPQKVEDQVPNMDIDQALESLGLGMNQ